MGTSDGFLCGGSINVNCQLASVLKNKHQAVSQGDYGLEAWRLEREEAKKGIKGFPSSFPASQPSSFGHTTHLQ